MDNYQETEHIISLFHQYLQGNLSSAGEAELFAWVGKSEENRLLFQKIRSKERIAQKLDFYLSTDKSEDWKIICQKTGIQSQHSILFRRWLQYAAIFIGLTLGIYLYLVPEYTSSLVTKTAQIKHDSVSPGSSQAYIELANGERIRLGNTDNKVEKKLKDVHLKEVGESLVLVLNDTISADTGKIEFNKISVPRGGEYQLVLADGTKVWLNSETKLEFPNRFRGSKRTVRLTGEAYFEVTHNEAMPFQVEINQVEVLVLGTSFNVYAYGDQINTTLVNGSVEIHTLGNTYRLKPGDQASVIKDRIKIEKVDVEEQMGWKNGEFIFREKPLEEIMNILARWYNLEIFYQNPETKNLHFTGNIPRHSSIGEVLKHLKRTHLVNFNIQDHTIVVTSGE